MRLSYRWLSEYVDLDGVSPEDLAVRLTDAGLAVDAVEPRNQGVTGVVVGHVLTCDQHPNADRLHVCTVDVGVGEALTIVCGASNVAAGQKIPTATVGAVLPDGKIGKAKLRGVESQGMLCSAKELGMETRLLSKEQTVGIYVLPAEAPIGEDAVLYLGLDDTVLEIDLTPNRSDCLSMRGLAYEVAALLERPLRFPDGLTHDGPPQPSHTAPVSIRIETPNCAKYEAQVMTGLRPAPSPQWMQNRLMACGVRSINAIVDVTNYVMLEWGQPLHAFDLDEVGQSTIVVRQGLDGEKLVTLDGEERSLTPEDIVIADPNRSIGLAGVMGGENSEVTDSTRRIVIESAMFAPSSVRRTGQRLGLRSEAQQRFEKGIDPVAVRGALKRATQLLVNVAGGVAVDGIVSEGADVDSQVWTVGFSPERCNQLLGTVIPQDTMQKIFQRLGLSVKRTDEGTPWQVTVPSRRRDIEMEADLVEEVGRIYGYDKIPSTLPAGATTAGLRSASQMLRKRTRDVLLGVGMTEVFTYTFSHPSHLEALGFAGDSPYRRAIPLLRPMSEERTVLRTHLLPGMAQVAAHNLAHGVQGGAIFEVGRVYWPESLPLTTQPTERNQWAGLWFGLTDSDYGVSARAYDFYDAKGAVEDWLASFGWLNDVRFERAERPWLHPGRTTEVILGKDVIGCIGALHPRTADYFGIGTAIWAEFDLDLLSEKPTDRWRVAALPRFPASRRDLAVLVSRDLETGRLTAAAQEVLRDKQILESCSVFDVYQGKGVADSQKSVAVAIVLRSTERTLTDEEIDRATSSVLETWQTKFGAVLRS